MAQEEKRGKQNENKAMTIKKILDIYREKEKTNNKESIP